MQFFRAALWCLVAGLIAGLGWVAATWYSAAAWDELRAADVMPIENPVAADGRSLAVLTNLPQHDRQILCEAVGPGEEERTPIGDSPVETSFTNSGSRWHVIAFMRAGRDGMHVECAAEDGRSDSANYTYATFTDPAERREVARIIQWTGFFVAMALIVWKVGFGMHSRSPIFDT